MRSIPITDPGNGATTSKPTVNPPVRSTPRGSCSEAGAITAANGWANLVPSPGGLNRPRQVEIMASAGASYGSSSNWVRSQV